MQLEASSLTCSWMPTAICLSLSLTLSLGAEVALAQLLEKLVVNVA
jgi:hypothetical protein